jgi:23S rRNA (cytosine1962-C5)-methyltransferase
MPDRVVHVVRKKSRGQHAWVFSNEVTQAEGNPGPGDTVQVFDRKHFLGSGIYNPHSLIRVRLYSDQNEELDTTFFRRRIEAALAYRKTMLPDENDFRLMYGESDRVPGLVIDKYGNHFVVQTYALGLDTRHEMVVAALREVFDVASVIEKNDFRLRDPEGLPRRSGVLFGTPEPRIVISESGAKFYVDAAGGQKTGYYFDHRLTRRKVRQLSGGLPRLSAEENRGCTQVISEGLPRLSAEENRGCTQVISPGRAVLDVFSYTGSFAINAALGGAEGVLAVDASAAAATIATDNSVLNGVAEKCTFATDNAFTALQRLDAEGRRFDLINLDPPAFIKAQKDKNAGMRGYREVNGLAMKLLPAGGILVSSSCSHYLFWQDMLDMLVAAAQDVGRTFTILDRTTQGPDHPVLLSMPESEYLRGFILQVS